jgi:hypothetical protein
MLSHKLIFILYLFLALFSGVYIFIYLFIQFVPNSKYKDTCSAVTNQADIGKSEIQLQHIQPRRQKEMGGQATRQLLSSQEKKLVSISLWMGWHRVQAGLF